MEEFNALIEKTKKGEATDAEEERLEALAPLFAHEQVRDFNASAERKKQASEKHSSPTKEEAGEE